MRTVRACLLPSSDRSFRPLLDVVEAGKCKSAPASPCI